MIFFFFFFVFFKATASALEVEFFSCWSNLIQSRLNPNHKTVFFKKKVDPDSDSDPDPDPRFTDTAMIVVETFAAIV